MIFLLQVLQLVQLLQFLFVIRENFWQIVVSYNSFVNFFPGGDGWLVRGIKMVGVVRVFRILGGRDAWVG